MQSKTLNNNVINQISRPTKSVGFLLPWDEFVPSPGVRYRAQNPSRQIPEFDSIVVAKGYRLFYGVLQFIHVPGPIEIHQQLDCLPGYIDVVAAQKKIHQLGDIKGSSA